MRQLSRAAIAAGFVSVALWLASYSWMLGLTPPTRWISRTASPWWVAEVAAVGAGTLSVVAGVVVATRSTGRDRRLSLWAAALGGGVAALSLLSLSMMA
jgi:hypothetical protein